MNMDTDDESGWGSNKLIHTTFQALTIDEETNMIKEINMIANLKSEVLPSGLYKSSDLNKLHPVASDLDMRNGPYLEVTKFMKIYLNDEPKDHCFILSQFMKALLEFRTTVLAEKLFLLRCTCYIILYREGPASFCIQQAHFLPKMLRVIMNDEGAMVESDWVKVQWYAKTMYDFLADDIYNFDYAIRLIANGSSALYNATIAAVLGLFKKITTGDHPQIFHVKPVQKFIRDLRKIKVSIFKNNLEGLHHLLIIISLYQNLVIIPGITDESCATHKSEFLVSHHHLKAYLFWIHQAKVFVARLGLDFGEDLSIRTQLQVLMDFDITRIFSHPGAKQFSRLFLNLGLHLNH